MSVETLAELFKEHIVLCCFVVSLWYIVFHLLLHPYTLALHSTLLQDMSSLGIH
jgi:hypothetical protein